MYVLLVIFFFAYYIPWKKKGKNNPWIFFIYSYPTLNTKNAFIDISTRFFRAGQLDAATRLPFDFHTVYYFGYQ
jgi:hypothetical protein